MLFSSAPHSSTFIPCDLGRYRISVPTEWPLSPIVHQPPGHSLHVQPESHVALDFHVLDKNGTQEILNELTEMHRRAATTCSALSPLDFPVCPEAGLRLVTNQMPNPFQRELYLFIMEGDLISASLSYANPPKNLQQLRRIFALMIGNALKPQLHARKDV